jgi:hypothetical protein
MVVFHAAACAVAGIAAVIDPARQAFVASRGRELGIQIPAAVAEWYAIDGAAEYLAEHSTNNIVPIEELGLAAGGRDLTAGRLLLAVENQCCCDWVVSLPPVGLASHDVPLPGIGTSSDHQTSWERATDPPVYLAEHGESAALWTPAAQRYSTYVHGEAWDIALFSMAYGTLAIDVPFRDDDLTVLREQFQAGPRTFGWATNFGGPGLTVYRFQRAGRRVQVATHPQETEWRLGADDGDLLAMLVDLLASTNQANQALARSLRWGRARQGRAL